MRAFALDLTPAGASCQVTAIEPRAGGRYRVTMSMPNGRVVEGSGIYREVVRPSRRVFTWFADYNRQETLITVTFRPDGAGTVMSFRQDGSVLAFAQRGFPHADEGYALVNTGWAYDLVSLQQ